MTEPPELGGDDPGCSMPFRITVLAAAPCPSPTHSVEERYMVPFMRFPLALIAALSLVLLATNSNLAAKELDPVEIPAKAMLTDILLGLREGDYDRYTRHFAPTLKKAFTKKNFTEAQQKLQKGVGGIQYAEYMGFIVWSGQTLALFKGHFDKTQDHVLIRLALDMKGKPSVNGIWFDAPALR